MLSLAIATVCSKLAVLLPLARAKMMLGLPGYAACIEAYCRFMSCTELLKANSFLSAKPHLFVSMRGVTCCIRLAPFSGGRALGVGADVKLGSQLWVNGVTPVPSETSDQLSKSLKVIGVYEPSCK